MDKLPKTWYVVATEQNLEVLSRWRFDDDVNKLAVGAVTGIMRENGSKEWDYRLYDEWKNEITFKQFQKWVLNIEVEPDYEIY